MTPVKLIDFITVLLMNKCDVKYDLDAEIIFSHKYILKFFETHRKFINEDEVIKILIL